MPQSFYSRGSTSLRYPGDFGKAEEDCNCRCVALTRAKWNLDEDELKTLKERAKFFGLDKKEDFKAFEEKYLKATKTLKNQGNHGIIKTDKQFGKKIGKHAVDYGLDPGKEEDRVWMRTMIDTICTEAEEILKGEWRGQPEPVKFYIRGDDVVVTTLDDVFITILKGGTDNARVKNARRK